MMTAPGENVHPTDESMRCWRLIVQDLRRCDLRPYVVINSAVTSLIENPREQQQFRTFLGEMVDISESYCRLDQGARFWDEQFRFLEEASILDMMKHFHLTIARQRVMIRLCPRSGQIWDSLDAQAA